MSHIVANKIKEVNYCFYVHVFRVMESKYGNFIGLWGLWQPFSKWLTLISMYNISVNNTNRKLIIVSMSLFSGSRNPNLTIALCQPLFVNMDATFYVLELHYLNNAARNNEVFFTLQSYLISVSSNYIALVQIHYWHTSYTNHD